MMRNILIIDLNRIVIYYFIFTYNFIYKTIEVINKNMTIIILILIKFRGISYIAAAFLFFIKEIKE